MHLFFFMIETETYEEKRGGGGGGEKDKVYGWGLAYREEESISVQ